MGKKYLDTKENTLESSILGVWEGAAEQTLERAKANLDARTKEYKVHQEKLAAARLRRENSKKLTKEEVEIDEEITEEESSLFELDDEEFDEAMKKKSSAERMASKKKRDKYMKTAAGKASAKKSKKRAAKVRSGAIKVDPKRAKAAKKRAKLYSGDELDEGTKEEYEKFFNSALKKFKIDSPADLKSDADKKEFFNYIDKNYTGEKDEGYDAFMKEKVADSKLTEGFAVPKDISAMEVGTDRYREYASDLTPGETDPEWVQARDFKVASMKEALAKVWGLDEKTLDKSSKEEYDEEDEELKPVKGSKTMTGGKVAKVDTKPKIDG